MVSLRQYVAFSIGRSKPESVCTTLRCDDKRTLDFSKLEDVRTTIHRDFPKPEDAMTLWRLVFETTWRSYDTKPQRWTNARLFKIKRRPYDTSRHRSDAKIFETEWRHYARMSNGRSTFRNWMAFVRHYVPTSIGRWNFRWSSYDTTPQRQTEARHFNRSRLAARTFKTGRRRRTYAGLPKTRKRLYDKTPRRRSDARLFKTRRRANNTTLRHRTNALLLETKWQTLDFDGVRTTSSRDVEPSSTFRNTTASVRHYAATFYFSKPDGDRTTLQRASILQIVEIFRVIGAKPHHHVKVADLRGGTNVIQFRKVERSFDVAA